jgi:Cu/Zn superoxide dismutase
VKRITKAVLIGVVGSAAMLAGTQVGNGAVPIYYNTNPRDLVDLQLAEGPFDDAKASLRIMQTTENGTNFKLRVEGIDTSAAGIKFGAHLHVGECKEGVPVGTSAGGHYNDQMFPAGTLTTYADAVKSPETEVWFDLVSDANGITADSTLVPFVPVDDDGIMSIVIHGLPHTDPNTGVAGARAACLPLTVPSAWIYQPPATI